MHPGKPFSVWMLLPALVAALFVPATCPAQSHEVADQFLKEAEEILSGPWDDPIKKARLYEKFAEAELATSEPRLAVIADKMSEAGMSYLFAGQDDKALDAYEQALEIYRKRGREVEIGSTLYYIGSVHSSLGQYDKALDSYEQVLEIARKLGHEVGIARVLNEIGMVYKARDQDDKVREISRKPVLPPP